MKIDCSAHSCATLPCRSLDASLSAFSDQVEPEKRLVKHLQKEVARLEAELRCPDLSSSHLRALLKEKDMKIEGVRLFVTSFFFYRADFHSYSFKLRSCLYTEIISFHCYHLIYCKKLCMIDGERNERAQATEGSCTVPTGIRKKSA